MQIKRFFITGITFANILKASKYYFNHVIFLFLSRPYYKLLISLMYKSHRNIWLKIILKLLVKSLRIEPEEFVAISDYLGLKSTDEEVLHLDKVTLSYSAPKFDELASNKSDLIEGIKYDHYGLCLRNATFFGSSSIIFLENGRVLYDLKLLDKGQRYWYTDTGIVYYKQNGLIIKSGTVKKEFKEAIWMGGNYSANYYHLLFEFLIKFEKLDSLDIPLDIPILIDKVCFEVPQFNELLQFVNVQDRQLIGVDHGCRYRVKKMYFINSPNIIPPNYINDRDLLPEDVQFDIRSLLALRSRLLVNISPKTFPKRIYISRSNASTRRQFNEGAVFNLLKEFGFVSVAPEELSATEQMALFNGADWIAGGSGAAFTNLIYCTNTSKAIIFAKTRLPFSGFSTIAAAVGADLRYVTEESTKGDLLKTLHDPFEIDISMLRKILTDWI